MFREGRQFEKNTRGCEKTRLFFHRLREALVQRWTFYWWVLTYKGGSLREGGQKILTDRRAGGFLFSVFSTFFLLSFWNRFGVDFGSIFRRFSGLKSQEISSKNRVCFLILFASGFLSFFRGPNLENHGFT